MNLFTKLQKARFDTPERQTVKINLYHGYEAEAIADVLQDDPELKSGIGVECMMVADSYLMTHMGRSTTQLESIGEQKWFMQFMAGLVKEVHEVILRKFSEEERPFLLADMPDGSTRTQETALSNAELMMAKGADAIKVELVSEEEYNTIELLSKRSVPVIAHIGYAPQKGESKRHGNSLDEALEFLELPPRIRSLGAVGLVLERVNESVNQVLCADPESGLLIYSIFSGKAKYGGQSLNVWDSVFFPRFNASYFPDTAKYDSSEYPEIYTQEIIQTHMKQLMRSTVLRKFPLSPPSKLSSSDIETIRAKAKLLWVNGI